MAPIRRGIRSIALHGQRLLHLGPRGLCLVVGCPRSATSSVCRWLNAQPGLVYASQSRILVCAHRLVEEVERLKTLEANREAVLRMTRRLVYTYYASSWLCWRRILVDKENLEPVALPDGRYGEFLRSVRELFPGMKLLFMIREPVATIWSITQRQWGYSLTRPDLRSYSVEDGIGIWQASAQLAVHYFGDPGAYICRFERLVAAPHAESRRILDFLGIRDGRPFSPRPTRVVGFSEADREHILHATKGVQDALPPGRGDSP